MTGRPKPARISKRGRREGGVLLPGLLREAEGADRIDFGIGRRDVIGRPARVRPDQFERLGPVLGLYCQFRPLLTEPYGAGMGRLGLLGDNQRLRPVAAIDSLTQQTAEPQKAGVFLFCQGAEGFLRFLLSPRQSARLGDEQQRLRRIPRR